MKYKNILLLDIKDEDDTYSVTLDLPVRHAAEIPPNPASDTQ